MPDDGAEVCSALVIPSRIRPWLGVLITCAAALKGYGATGPGVGTIYSREFGGSDGDYSTAVTVDGQGNTYIAGFTYSTNFPGTANRVASDANDADVFVVKLNPAGELIFSRVLGGSGFDQPAAIALDAGGHIYVAGRTTSTNFPTFNAFQPVALSNGNVFVFKLDAAGAALVYSTYLGGNAYESAIAVAATTNGETVVAGSTSSSDFPTAIAGQNLAGNGDGFVVKLGAQGTNLVFARRLGGSGLDNVSAMTLDSAGNIYVAGSTWSLDFPVTANAYQTEMPWSGFYGFGEIFVTKLPANGQSLLYSTFLGTSASDSANAMVADAAGAVYIAGTDSRAGEARPASPVAPGDLPPPPTVEPIQDAAFLARLAPSGSQLNYLRRWGTSGYDSLRALNLNNSGALHLAGYLSERLFSATLANPSVDPGSNFSSFATLALCDNLVDPLLVFGPSGNLHRSSRYGFAGSAGPYPISLEQFYERRRHTDVTAQALSIPASTSYPPVVSMSRLDFYSDRFGPNDVIYAGVYGGNLHGEIARVSVVAGTNTLATFPDVPRLVALTNLSPGSYALSAIASNTAGLCSTSCPIAFTVFPAPANDSFYYAARITGTSYVVNASNNGASLEPAEPAAGSYRYPTGRRSVWWCWTAPVSGPFNFGVSSDEVAAEIDVFTGSSLSQLQRIASAGPGMNSGATFRAVAGTTYFIAVNSAVSGEFTLTLRVANPPANDDYANGIAFTGANLTLQASNIDATYEPGVSWDVPASVWWRWTAPTSGVYLAAVAFEEFQPQLAVRSVNDPGLGQIDSWQQRVVFRANTGEQFDLRVNDSSGQPGHFSLSISNVAAPANDFFAAATTMNGFPASASGNGLGASVEANEPGSASATVWYRWTAPSNATVVAEVSPRYQALIAAYSGTAIENLVLLTGDFYSGVLSFVAEAGRDYFIQVDDYYNVGSDFMLTLRPARSPTNDHFANAVAIQGLPVSRFGSNLESSLELGEPSHYEESVWYRWTAPSNGLYTATVEGAYQSMLVTPYTGSSVSNLAAVLLGTRAPESPFATRFFGNAGAEYYLAVSGYAGSGGAFRLEIRPAIPPPNDNFASRVPLSGSVVQTNGSNVDAGSEPGEIIPELDSGATVWWTWTAPETRKVLIRLSDVSASARLQIFTGTNLPSLTLVSPPSVHAIELVIDAEAGRAYAIQVGGRRQGAFALNIAPVLQPPNDHFTNAFVLTGILASTTGTSLGATREPGEPVHPYTDAGSVWWNWTAPASGLVSVTLSGGFFQAPVVVYAGNSVSTLTNVSGSDSPYPWRYNGNLFTARAGVTYRIAAYAATTTPFRLTLTAPAPRPNPRLESMRQLPDGTFELAFEVTPGQTNVIEASTDLLNWTPIATNVLDCGILNVLDPHATNFAHRFYRLRKVE